jgi:UDP-GlcNAc:undecaprenyl-phosphate GlcNAc-1-phosphate transferase
MSNDFQISIYLALFIAILISFTLNFTSLRFIKNNFSKSKKYEKRLSSQNIPTFGGIAMSISFFVSTRLLGEVESDILQLAFFAIFITLIGLLDDIYNLNWKAKFTLQVIAIGIPIFTLEIYLQIEALLNLNFNNLLNSLVSVFWILLIVNSLNFLDNMDGLAATVSIFIAISLSLLSYTSNQFRLTDISIVLFGSILGFLYFNYPSAKLYMGDSGSLFIGYCLGFISILFSWNSEVNSFWNLPVPPVILFFSIPLIDFITVVISRLKNGKSPMTGGTDHISHRLINLGYSSGKVILSFAIFSIFIFLITLTILFTNQIISIVAGFIYFIIVLITLLYVQKLQPLN